MRADGSSDVALRVIGVSLTIAVGAGMVTGVAGEFDVGFEGVIIGIIIIGIIEFIIGIIEFIIGIIDFIIGTIGGVVGVVVGIVGVWSLGALLLGEFFFILKIE